MSFAVITNESLTIFVEKGPLPFLKSHLYTTSLEFDD